MNSGLPILPLKFLFAVEMATSPSARTPLCVPTHGPHPGPTTVHPDFMNISINPFLAASRYISFDAGAMINFTSGLIALALQYLCGDLEIFEPAVSACADICLVYLYL